MHNTIMKTTRIFLLIAYQQLLKSTVISRILQSLQQRFPLFLIPRFPEQCEHILLIAFHTRLIERIYAQQITGYAAGKLKKVEKLL